MALQSAWQSVDAYVFVNDLSPALLAWEWLRRNRDYQGDYVAWANARTAERETLTAMMQDRWGLRFPD